MSYQRLDSVNVTPRPFVADELPTVRETSPAIFLPIHWLEDEQHSSAIQSLPKSYATAEYGWKVALPT